MTLTQIKDAVAAYLHRTTDELTVNSVDLGLVALNHVRNQAELNHNFGFTRKLAQVSVDGVTGGSLDNAVDVDGAPINGQPPVAVKSIIDIGVADSVGNISPIEWTSGEDSANRTRQDNPFSIMRYPTDAQALCGPVGQRRVVFAGNQIHLFPRSPDTTLVLLMDVYSFTSDWTDTSLSPTATFTTPWVTHGSNYLIWAAVIQLNHMFKDFVFRQEGNLPPPQTLADNALESMKMWDTFKYEQFRRHSR